MTRLLPWPARPRPPYKLLSVLLQYPAAELLDAEEELGAAIAALPPSPLRQALDAFWADWRTTPPLARAQRYVETFDLQKRTSLYLTYYGFGDTRKRGQALVRLKRRYAAAGWPQAARELPDYLPLMLEFAALAPDGAGAALLEEHRPGIELLRRALAEQGSPYHFLLDALCAGLRRLGPAELGQIRTLAAEGPPREQVGLEPFAPPEVLPGLGARP